MTPYRLPIIASNIPANKEVLGEDKALWVEPENIDDLAKAINKGIHSNEGLNEAVKYNYDYVMSNYTWPKIAAKYINYIENL